METPQTYKNHVRWYPLVHFIITPLLAFHLIWSLVVLIVYPNWDRAEYLLLAIILILVNFAARLQALKAQDRIIRLEETLRYRTLLSSELAAKACALSTGKIIALRFAADEELSALIERVLAGEFNTNREIKQAVQNWRGDYLRV